MEEINDLNPQDTIKEKSSLLSENSKSFQVSEKTYFLKVSYYATIISICIGMIEIVFSTLFLLILGSPLTFSLIGISIPSQIFVIWLFFWLRRIRKEQIPRVEDNLPTKIAFVTASLMIIGRIMIIAGIYGHFNWVNHYLDVIASDPAEWGAKFNGMNLNTLKTLSDIGLISLSIINGISGVYFAFLSRTVFICLENPIKLVVLFCNVLGAVTLLFGGTLYSSGQNGLYYVDSASISVDFPTWILQAIKICGIITTPFAFFTLLSNLFQRRIFYFALSMIGVFLTITMLTITGYSYRYTDELNSQISSKLICPQILGVTHRSDLISYGCLNKYANVALDSCPQANRAEIWEQDEGKAADEKIHQEGCLNENCCQAVADLYSEVYYVVSDVALTVSLSLSALTIWLMYLLEAPIQAERDQRKTIPYKPLFGSLFLLIVTVVLMVAFEFPKIATKGATISFNSGVFSQYTPLTEADFGEQAGFHIADLQFQCNGPDCAKIDDPNYQLTVMLLAVDARWEYNRNFTNPKVVLLAESYKSTIFPRSDDNDGFLGLQGEVSEITRLLQEYFKIYPVYPGVDVQISVKTSQHKIREQVDFEVISIGSGKVITIQLVSTLRQVVGGLVYFQNSQGKFEPISPSGVNVTVQRLYGLEFLTENGTKANSRGEYAIDLPQFRRSLPYLTLLTVSKPGYQTYRTVLQVGGFPYQTYKNYSPIQLIPQNISQPPSNSCDSLLALADPILEVTVVNAVTGQLISDAQLDLGFLNEKGKYQIAYTADFESATKDKLIVRNLQKGSYFLRLRHSEYLDRNDTLAVTLGEDLRLTLTMLPKRNSLRNDQIFITIDRFRGDLPDFRVSFEAGQGDRCDISQVSPFCKGIKLRKTSSDFMTATLTETGPFFYQFYSVFSANATNNGRIALKVYVGGLHFPAVAIDALSQPLGTQNITGWIGFCLDGTKGPQSLLLVNSFWTQANSSTSSLANPAACAGYYQNLA
mgnify:CR=1 FL=1